MKHLYFLIILCVVTITSLPAQIPNFSFEQWDHSAGYDNPVGWENTNSHSAPSSVYTCEKGVPGYSVASFLKVTSRTLSGTDVVPGIAVSGRLDASGSSGYQARSGFAFSQRPQSLTGVYQYMAYGADQGYIDVLLTRWNGSQHRRDTIAYSHTLLIGMKMQWDFMNIALDYKSNESPDSAIIVLSASGTRAVNDSYIFMDTMTFAGTAPLLGISDQSSDLNVEIFPVPTASLLYIHTDQSGNAPIDITLLDMTGRVIFSDLQREPSSTYTINISSIAKGMYWVSIHTIGATSIKKIIVD